MKDWHQLLAGLIDIVAYAMLVVGIWRAKIEQSFAAFALWGMLDGIATITSIIAGGNIWLAGVNASGSVLIAILLVTRKQLSWTWIESMTALLVVICLLVWYSAGETAGVVASSLAVFTAGIPQMADTWRKPQTTPTATYFVFLVADFVSLAAGTDWSVKERFYASCSITLTLIILIPAVFPKMTGKGRA